MGHILALNFECLDLEHSVLACRSIFGISWLASYMKITRSRLRSQEQQVWVCVMFVVVCLQLKSNLVNHNFTMPTNDYTTTCQKSANVSPILWNIKIFKILRMWNICKQHELLFTSHLLYKVKEPSRRRLKCVDGPSESYTQKSAHPGTGPNTCAPELKLCATTETHHHRHHVTYRRLLPHSRSFQVYVLAMYTPQWTAVDDNAISVN